MPEGVEVKLNVNYINKLVQFNNLIDISIIGGRYTRHGYPMGYKTFKKQLPLTLYNVMCKGKGIFFEFTRNWYIYNTLGMAGMWCDKCDKYSTLKLKFMITDEKNVEKIKYLYFRDVRNFGTIKFIRGSQKFNREYTKLGPDMMNADTSYDIFYNRLLKHSSKNITKVLMNQSIVSGIGNYIKSESLYRANISPFNNVSDISVVNLKKLYKEIKSVMLESYLHQSLNGYLSNIFMVYSKKYDPFGNQVVTVKTPDGRTTHWVEELQI